MLLYAIIIKSIILASYYYALSSEHASKAMKVVFSIACTLTSCDDFRHIINDPAHQACKHALELHHQTLQEYEYSYNFVAQRNDELESLLRKGVIKNWWALLEEHED